MVKRKNVTVPQMKFYLGEKMKTKYIFAISMIVFAIVLGAIMGITYNVSALEIGDENPSQNGHRGGGENLESVAEALGIPVEELQEALQNARPAECAEGERPEGVDCKPDFETVASTLGITVEELEAAFQSTREKASAERLSSAAETLGVTVEALQTALENARPAECVDGEKPEGVNCRPDFESVANELGVTTEELQSALGKGGSKGGKGKGLENVAEALGVTVEELQQALQDARPAECVGLERGEKPEGVDCRPDLQAAAESLGVDAEELQTALQNERGGKHRPGENNDERERP